MEQADQEGVSLLVPEVGQTVEVDESYIADTWRGRAAIWAKSGRDTLDE